MTRPDKLGLLDRFGRLLATLFIAFHLIAIALWVFPFNASLTSLLRKVVGPYFSLMGLRQDWSLFAPDPMMANSYVDAQVILQNGDVRTWTFPRLEALDFKDRYSKARYRKFTGWLFRKSFSYAWPDTARYIARQFDGSAVPPRTVKLIRHWARIPPMDSELQTPASWHTTVFFVYQISPDGLR